MDVPVLGAARKNKGEIAPDAMAAAHARILRICIFAGLPPIDAEDIAQDIWLWLIKTGRWEEANSLPWLGGVAANFVRRHWRARTRRDSRESQAAIANSVRRSDGAIDIDTKLSLDEMERALPAVESELLRLVRKGATFAEAARTLGIPRGSQDYFRKRLHSHLSLGLTRGHGSAEAEEILRDTAS